MNERIRELSKQATTYIEPTPNSGEGWIFDKEKFAESLIEECIQVLKNTGYPNAHGNCVGVEELKQHFGIK